MFEIDEAFVDNIAPNLNAIKNGRATALKSVGTLHHNPEKDLLFAEIKGSGSVHYLSSVDFINPATPIYRCSCPSRQIPCKHVLGLLYAFVQGKTLTEAPSPQTILEKREKATVRAEKKAQATNKPKKVNKSALTKKIKAQLAGLDKLEQLLHDLCQNGLGSIGAKALDTMDQLAKQLASAYLPGARNGLRELRAYFVNFVNDDNKPRSNDALDTTYATALDQLTRLQSLCNKGRTYLQARLEDPELRPETDTSIAALLGHAWQLTELKEVGCIEEAVTLLQLAFTSYDDEARQEFVDEGIWINSTSGAVQRTLTYRPYTANKLLKEEDSFFQCAQVAELYIYPGDLNPRIRWETMQQRRIEPQDYATLFEHAQTDLNALVKTIKNALRVPLSEKQPLALLHFSRLAHIESQLLIEDAQGNHIGIADCGRYDPPTCHLLRILPDEILRDNVALLRFHYDLDIHRLVAQILSFVTTEAIIRLTY